MDLTFEYVSRLRYHEDESGTVLKCHLLIEHVLDLMITKGFKRPKNVLSDHRSFSFSVKARMLFETDDVPECTFDNIVRLNKIRNELAHNLVFNEDKIDFRFSRIKDGEPIVVDLRKVTKKHKNPLKRYLFLLGVGTLSQLQNAYYERHGSFPLFDHPIEFEAEDDAETKQAAQVVADQRPARGASESI